MKKLLCLLVAFLLVMQMPAYARGNTFTDVSGDEYYAEAAKQLYNAGFIGGYEDGSLRADRAVTRAEMATFICRLLGAEDEANEYKGTTTELTQDVSANHWASGYVAFAVKHGIVNGDGNGKFRPEDKVRYQEAVKMLVCAAGLEETVETVPGDWAAGYMNAALDAGILNNVIYDGGDYSNRSDVIMMLYNVITYIQLEKPEDNDYEREDNIVAYELNLKISGCGGIYDRSGDYYPGSYAYLQVSPGHESGFIRWTTTGGTLSDPEGTSCVLTMPDEDVVVCAEFAGAGEVVREYDPDDDYWYLIDDADIYEEEEEDYSQPERDVAFEDFEEEVIRLVNIERKKHGLNELVRDEDLSAVAYAHSCDMRDRGFFSHTNPDGKSPFDRMREYGISYRSAAENIANGHATPASVVEGWMNSDGHRANILSEKMKYIGVGVCRGGYGYLWTQCFTG